MEAAQQAISSPLLDNVSIQGATGVLINITHGPDLTMDELTRINDIIHDAAGGDAEIIFGNRVDEAMQGEVRVTVIATGFDRQLSGEPGMRSVGNSANVLPFPAKKQPAPPPPPINTTPAPLRNWTEPDNRAAHATGGNTATSADDAADLSRLRQENAELRRANEILKTASAFFAATELDRRLK